MGEAIGVLLTLGCGDGERAAPGVVMEQACEVTSGSQAPEFLRHIGCSADFEALASLPLDTTLPGARSVKVVLDLAEAERAAPYFQNSRLYPIHYDFASTHLSGGSLPTIGSLADFNAAEYYTPTRRFLLGALTHYDAQQVWALELAPYDTASPTMVARLYQSVRAAGFFGPALMFHPTSEAVAAVAKQLPSSIRVATTDELYAHIDFQPLTLGTSIGRLRFAQSATLDANSVSYQDIMVLDSAPNDIPVVQGLITEAFQTPLSHVNVLSQNRHTPNMGLRGASTNSLLRSLEGKLVELSVDASSWSAREVSEHAAQEFWDAHRPSPITLPALNLDVNELTDVENVTPEPSGPGASLRDAIKTAVQAFGGKAAHYSILYRTPGVPIEKAFAVPVYYYDRFMRQNGFYDAVDALLADSEFANNAQRRAERLADLQANMLAGSIDAGFQDALRAKLAADYPGLTMRFRTSTNSEDLDGFPCAGCYDSHTGDPTRFESVLDAIRKTYASAWKFRTFEERSYYGIDHKSIGMALLVHHNFPAEEANGVAVTANPFDASGVDPAFYVNVQWGGDAEVVAPPRGVTSDQFLYFFNEPNQPISYIAHSNLVQSGETVLSSAQVSELGAALAAIHSRFSAAYGPAAGNHGFYAMDVEFKFDDEKAPNLPATLFIKQARPYPGRGN